MSSVHPTLLSMLEGCCIVHKILKSSSSLPTSNQIILLTTIIMKFAFVKTAAFALIFLGQQAAASDSSINLRGAVSAAIADTESDEKKSVRLCVDIALHLHV